jgi:hypothetical protein
MAMTNAALASRNPADALAPDGPVPSLTRRITELLRIEEGDLVVDLCCRNLGPPRVVSEGGSLLDGSISRTLFSERLAFRLLTSGVRMVQTDARTFGRISLPRDKVLLRDGFSLSELRLHEVLTGVFDQLPPMARVLIADSVPSSDAPLVAKGLERWKRQRRSPEGVAELMTRVGFSAEVAIVESPRRASTAACYAWVESREWPILASFPERALRSGLRELRARYGSERMVDFTSRFDLVLGVKAKASSN